MLAYRLERVSLSKSSEFYVCAPVLLTVSDTVTYNISMNDRIKKWLVLGIVSSIISGMFWFVYSLSGSIVLTIGITTGVCINIVGILYMLGKRKKS